MPSAGSTPMTARTDLAQIAGKAGLADALPRLTAATVLAHNVVARA